MYYQRKLEIIEAIFYDGSEESANEIIARLKIEEIEAWRASDGYLETEDKDGSYAFSPQRYCIITRNDYSTLSKEMFEKLYSPTTLHLCDK